MLGNKWFVRCEVFEAASRPVVGGSIGRAQLSNAVDSSLTDIFRIQFSYRVPLALSAGREAVGRWWGRPRRLGPPAHIYVARCASPVCKYSHLARPSSSPALSFDIYSILLTIAFQGKPVKNQ